MQFYIDKLKSKGTVCTVDAEIKDELCRCLQELSIQYECTINHYFQFQITLLNSEDKMKI